MSLTTEFLIAAAIIVSVVVQFGRKELNWIRMFLPLAIVTGFAVYYLRAIPTSGGDGWFTLAGLATGLVLGVLAAALMAVQEQSGRVFVTAGIAYIGLWVVVFGARLVFAYVATNSPESLRQVFIWSFDHGITEAGWTAAFMLQALAMVGLRTVVMIGRVLAMRRPLASFPA
ncbi:MAG TPA: hypothetical protein VHQ03_11695 [Candidatus Dormibacteraeota bacterium]|jgi:hypothetical protein|nr:hypothetical protein [Candidatus Dormibacteraeota bacterium]